MANQDATFSVTVKERPGTVIDTFQIKVFPRFTAHIFPKEASTIIGGEMRFTIKFAPTPADYEGLVRMWVRNLPRGFRCQFTQNPAPMSSEVGLVIKTNEMGPVGEWELILACIEVPSLR